MKEFLENFMVLFWIVIAIVPMSAMLATGLFIGLFKSKGGIK